jgi:Ca-activated chloride channel family protein
MFTVAAEQGDPGGRAARRNLSLSDAAGGKFLAVRAVDAEVACDGPLARTRLTVTFHNDLGRTLEGDLVFPLPPTAALRELSVKVGARTIEGKIRARGRARAEYARAVAAGHTAALGESEGEDLARLRIAPIDGGEDVVVTLSVEHALLPIADGHRLIVPLTYMPRFVEDDAAMKETERAAVERPRPLTLAARANVTVRVEHQGDKPPSLRCTSHKTETRAGKGRTEIAVRDAALDRDLQIEIADRPSGDRPSVWIRHDGSDGPDQNGPTTAVAIVPPAFADEGPTIPRTVTFLVDRSGSMQGRPMESAIRAVRGCLRALGPDDRFNVLAFDDRLEALAPVPVPFDDATLSDADRFVAALSARGGTAASMAIDAALRERIEGAPVALNWKPKADQVYRLRLVVFMTDGDVAGAEGVLAAAKDELSDTRVHVFGIGDAVNHAMLAQLATLGGGTYTPVATDEDLERALARLKNAITAPLWTNIRALVERDGERRAPRMLEPVGPLDLFAGQPVLLAFRGPLQPGDRLVLQGQRADGEDQRVALDLALPSQSRAEGAGAIWALLRNQRLTYRFDSADDDTLEGLGTAFGVVNRKVALVGVHGDERQAPIEGSVPVVLPMPRSVAEGELRSLASLMPMSAAPVARGGGPPPPPAFGPPPAPGGFGPPPPAPRAAGPVPQRSKNLPSPAKPAAPVPGMARAAARSAPSAPEAKAAPSAPSCSFTADEAGLRALFLHQNADGLFGGDLAATLAAVAALVGRGHTSREGLFRAELRRTLLTLRGRAGGLSGNDRLLALLAVALLTMAHGDPAPEGLPAQIADDLADLSLQDLQGARAKIRAALAAAPAGWSSSALASEVQKVFL